MKNKHTITLIVFAFVLWCTGAFAQGQSEHSPNDSSYVIILSIDGFPASSLWDQQVPVPTLRQLAREGVWSRGLQPSNPTVTWPNHTSVVTGVHPREHFLLFNGKVERSENGRLPVRLNPRQDKADLVAVPTLYDVAFENGLKTAEINWPATRNAGTLHDSFPDVPDNVGNMTPDLQWDLFEFGILDDMTNFALWQHSSPGRDRVWQQSASYLIENRMPNLLLIHLLNVDSTHHRFGVNTQPGYTALALADYHLRELIHSLEKAGVKDQATIFVIADHGFVNTPITLLPNLILHQAGFLELDEDRQMAGGRAQVIATGGFGMVYFNDEDAENEELIRNVKELFSAQEGIYKVINADEFHEYGLPHPDETDQAGRLAIFTEPGYGMNVATEHDEVLLDSREHEFAVAHHGFLNSFEQMNALFVMWGRGVEPGVELGLVDGRSVAPTAARLLGLNFPADNSFLLENALKK